MISEQPLSPVRETSNPVKSLFSPLFLYLSFKELWRYKGRFFLVSLVIALITVLVLFVAGLAEGLGQGNIQYLQKMNAELVIYRQNADLSIAASSINPAKLNDVQRIEGVQAVGPLGFSSVTLMAGPTWPALDVSLIGVEPGKPGEPPALQGRNLEGRSNMEAIIGKMVALRTGLSVGDSFQLNTVQGTEEEYYTLRVVGISDGQQYSIQPSIFVPYMTWNKIRPQPNQPQADLIFNVMAVKLENPADLDRMARRLESQVDEIEAVDRRTAYEATPGYSAQQSTLNTQRFFTLLIGVLVIGGFFQIQTLQKVAQTGMLKAIGVSNLTIVLAFLTQIIIVSLVGLIIGGLGTALLALVFPVTIPLSFNYQTITLAVVSLLLIGPAGGLVSLRLLLKVEPLTALGLAQ